MWVSSICACEHDLNKEQHVEQSDEGERVDNDIVIGVFVRELTSVFTRVYESLDVSFFNLHL